MVGWYTIFYGHILTLLQMFSSLSGVLRIIEGVNDGLAYIVVWSIWKSHNDIVFSGTSVTKKEVEDRCIFLAWK